MLLQTFTTLNKKQHEIVLNTCILGSYIVLLVCLFSFFSFLVASLDGLRPLLVTSDCSFCSVFIGK